MTKWSAITYLAFLVVVTGMLRCVGEDWWFTCMALYVPRVGFAVPIGILLTLMLAFRQFNLLWTQAVAGLWVLFPMMGLEMPSPSFGGDSGQPSIRILSINADSGYYGYERIASTIIERSPDIALIQEAFGEYSTALKSKLETAYPHVHQSTEFIIASRFAIGVVTTPERLRVNGELRSPRFIRYEVATPIGQIALYSIHPASPRDSFYKLCGDHCRNALLSGRMFLGTARPDIDQNTRLRAAQFTEAVNQASKEALPVVLAGDTNLPNLSKLLAKALQNYEDGFSQAGTGFGYTFHKRMPWMRIDRILTGRELRVTKFAVACQGISDHFCVVADVARR